MLDFKTIYLILTVLAGLLFVVFLTYEYYERKTGVPTFPTMPPVRRRIAAKLQAELKRTGQQPFRVLDLGSGSGQLGFTIARAIPAAAVTGIELSYIPWLRSVIRQRLWGVKNLTYLRQDFWPYDISQFDAVVTYLPGTIMEKVGDKLHRELKPGTLIIANVFALRAGWEPIESLDIKFYLFFKTKLFVYRKV